MEHNETSVGANLRLCILIIIVSCIVFEAQNKMTS